MRLTGGRGREGDRARQAGRGLRPPWPRRAAPVARPVPLNLVLHDQETCVLMKESLPPWVLTQREHLPAFILEGKV